MNIIEKTYKLNGDLRARSKTTRIILHHAAATNCTVEQIDSWHKGNGWTCIGYHFFVNKKGEVYRGRREDTVGAHASDNNSDSIGVCAEGNFENETMPEAQKEALKELVAYLKDKYKISKVQGHKDVNATACPGKNYPFDEIAKATTQKPKAYTHKDFVKEVQKATGAKVDGIAGSETLSKTVTVSAKKNNRHAVVKPIQKYLATLGYTEVGTADGIAGAKFTAATKRYQKENGCVADGEITARNKTWKKLLKLA
jgi:N-acetyl-anhydromuramyl-L-alanine amidase AmpD